MLILTLGLRCVCDSSTFQGLRSELMQTLSDWISYPIRETSGRSEVLSWQRPRGPGDRAPGLEPGSRGFESRRGYTLTEMARGQRPVSSPDDRAPMGAWIGTTP